GCLGERHDPPSPFARDGSIGMYFNDTPDDCCSGGDTQVRIVDGQFVVHGIADDSQTGTSFCTSFHVVCNPPGFPPTSGPYSFQQHTEWTATPVCKPIKASDLEGSNAVGKVDAMVDLDADGIPDCWELEGARIQQADGTVVTMPLPGAKPGHKDLFVDVDYMT